MFAAIKCLGHFRNIIFGSVITIMTKNENNIPKRNCIESSETVVIRNWGINITDKCL